MTWPFPSVPRVRWRRIQVSARAVVPGLLGGGHAVAPSVSRIALEGIPAPRCHSTPFAFVAASAPPTAISLCPGTAIVQPVGVTLRPAVTSQRREPGAAFFRPTRLKRTFARLLGPSFLSEGSAEDHLLAMLSASSLKDARTIARHLDHAGFDTWDQRVLFDDIHDLVFGLHDAGTPWGEDAAADALRVRLLRRKAGPPVAPCWTGFLRWAGQRIADGGLRAMPDAAGPAALAAIAAASGYRRAFEAAPTPSGTRDPSLAHPTAILALRAFLEGAFVPRMAGALLPQARRRTSAEDENPWGPLLLAWHVAVERDDVPAVAHLTAVLAATDLRERLLAALGRDAALLPALRRSWGASLEEDSLFKLVAAVRLHPKIWATGRRTVWPAGWGGPNVDAVVDRLDRLLGGNSAVLPEMFLDDGLAVAAVFGVLGFVPSAMAQMAAAAPQPAVAAARRALHEALARRREVRPHPLAAHPLGPDAARVYARVRKTADPSVAIGTPFWMIQDRGALVSWLMRQRRRDLASEIRTVLDRDDLLRDLLPFWILRGRPADTQSVHALARWVARADRPGVASRRWLAFLERRCREMDDER